MPLKIIHHKTQEEKGLSKENDHVDLRQNLTRILFFCEKIVNFANLTLDNLKMENFLLNSTCGQNNNFENKTEYLLDAFSIILGKKVSLLDAVTKATLIISRVCKLANEFGVSFDENFFTNNEEVLTDEDIDIMVRLVKDFGEKQIREDARECRENITKDLEKQNNKTNEIDVYDIYHDINDNCEFNGDDNVVFDGCNNTNADFGHAVKFIDSTESLSNIKDDNLSDEKKI